MRIRVSVDLVEREVEGEKRKFARVQYEPHQKLWRYASGYSELAAAKDINDSIVPFLGTLEDDPQATRRIACSVQAMVDVLVSAGKVWVCDA